MLVEMLSVAKVAGETMLKLIPISIAFGIVFAVLTHWSACNPGRPWWRKREIVTDICYWFLIPLAARFVRIGFMVMGAAYLYGIHGADALMAFYDDGFGPLAQLPLWAQALTFLVVSDFLTYWIHRGFHRGSLWRYHSVQHIFRHGSRGCRPVACRHFAERDAVGGPVHHGHVGLRARQSELDARAVQICHRRTGVSPLASYGGRSRRLHEFRRHVPHLG